MHNGKTQKIDNGQALEIDKDNVKVLFRRGQAFYYLKEFEKASDDFSAALKLEPNNAEVKKNLKIVQDKVKEQKEKEKKMYQKMFG